MTRLEKGVLVRCCNAKATGDVLVEGSPYKVTAVDCNPDVVMLYGFPGWWMMSRFELVSAPATVPEGNAQEGIFVGAVDIIGRKTVTITEGEGL